MIIKNGAVYENNYARAAAYFLGTCAPTPMKKERQCAYELITGIYSFIASDAETMGYKVGPDVTFGPWEKQKGREKDIKSIRGAITKIEELISELFLVIEAAEILGDGALLPEGVKLGKPLKKALCAGGMTIDTYNNQIKLVATKECLEGLKELAVISRAHTIPSIDGENANKPYLYFSRCVWETEENWLALAFDKLLDAKDQLIWLCNELEKRGYRRIDCFDGKHISLNYVKQHGEKEEPIKGAWAERTHSGIELTYEDLRLEPCFLWMRMPMFKTILECAPKLPEHVVGFIRRFTKPCDSCRYCVQTDKSHTRPLACVEVEGEKKCSIFPGFTMNWRELPPELAQYILYLLDALNDLSELAYTKKTIKS